ncbi:MAG: Na(+)/H(+) antiporter subunit B [Thermoprotei archaeon]
MNHKRIFYFLVILLLVFIASAISVYIGFNPPQKEVRPLGEYYLRNSYFGEPSAKSPEAVTAIVWDYRGLDTIFEVTVFFLAIMGGLTIFRLEKTKEMEKPRYGLGLTLVVSQATRILTVLIVAVSASIALHGHLTPGGGFQGGTALAIAPLLVLVAYSRYTLGARGITYVRAVIARSLSLTLMLVVVLLPVAKGLHVLQNQPFYPAEVFGQLISGSLWFYNLLDYIAIGMGFTAIFLYLSIPEEIYKKELGVEK